MPRRIKSGRITGHLSHDEATQLKNMYETGKYSYAELAEMFNVSTECIRKRASRERWLSMHKIKMLANDDERLAKEPDSRLKSAALMWKEREERHREKLFEGATASLERFWLTNPVPGDFAEAERAMKMADRAIGQDGGQDDPNMSVLINGPVQVNNH